MESTHIRPRQNRLALPFGFFAGPVAWALQLFVSYALLPAACRSGSKLGLYLTSLVAGAVVLIAGLLAYRRWRDVTPRRQLFDLEAQAGRQAFVAVSGVLLCSLFFLLVVYTGIGQIFLSACPVNTIPFP